MKAERGSSEVWLYSFFNLGSRWRLVVNATPLLRYHREKDSLPVV